MFRATIRSILLISILAAIGFRELRAETSRIELPEKYVAFAMRTENGDLVAVDQENGIAALFSAKDLTAGATEPSATLRIGDKPRKVCCKQFGDKTYYAVICQLDAHVYVIDAADFSLAKRVPIAAGSPTYVAGSDNPADPFVFYNRSGGGGGGVGYVGSDHVCGVVDLRTMKDVGKLFDDARETTLSADGKFAYRQADGSFAQLASLQRMNALDAETPTFMNVISAEQPFALYVPDPRGRYTAHGSRIYSPDLKTIAQDLSFVPVCFARERPLIFGYPAEPASDQELYLQALSYNSFSTVGEPVVIKLSKAVDMTQAPIGVVPPHPKVFADDVHDRLIVGYLGDVYLIPYADFQAPEEPLLASTFVAPETFEVGQRYEIQIKISDPRTRIVVRGLPDGIEARPDKLIWTPTEQQVGVAEFRYSLILGELETTIVEKRKVEYPHIALPFSASELRIDAEGSRAVVWSRQDRFASDFGPPGSRPATPQRLAVVDLNEKKTLVEKAINSRIVRLAVAGEYVLVAYEDDPMQVEVLNLSDLKRATALRIARPVGELRVFAEFAVVTFEGGAEVYKLGTWESVLKADSPLPFPMRTAVTPEGLALAGALYDETFARKLIFEPGRLTSVAAFDAESASLRFAEPPKPEQPFPGMFREGEPITVKKALPGSSIEATAELMRMASPFVNPYGTAQPRDLLSLRFEGAIDRRVTLDDRTRPAPTTHRIDTPVPQLETAPDRAVVLLENRIYVVSVEPSGDAEPVAKVAAMSFVPRQSAFWIGEEPSTVLKHDVQGAKGPLQFELRRPVSGMTIDASSGDVTVDAAALRKFAIEGYVGSREGSQIVQALAKQQATGNVLPATDRASPAAMLRRAQTSAADAGERLTGRKSTGIPVAVPVYVSARDAEGGEATLQYFVLVDASVDQVVAQMKAKSPTAPVILSGPEAAAARPQARPMNDPVEVQRRLKSLEDRVDLLSRQLEQALQKLDQLAPRARP